MYVIYLLHFIFVFIYVRTSGIMCGLVTSWYDTVCLNSDWMLVFCVTLSIILFVIRITFLCNYGNDMTEEKNMKCVLCCIVKEVYDVRFLMCMFISVAVWSCFYSNLLCFLVCLYWLYERRNVYEVYCKLYSFWDVYDVRFFLWVDGCRFCCQVVLV